MRASPCARAATAHSLVRLVLLSFALAHSTLAANVVSFELYAEPCETCSHGLNHVLDSSLAAVGVASFGSNQSVELVPPVADDGSLWASPGCLIFLHAEDGQLQEPSLGDPIHVSVHHTASESPLLKPRVLEERPATDRVAFVTRYLIRSDAEFQDIEEKIPGLLTEADELPGRVFPPITTPFGELDRLDQEQLVGMAKVIVHLRSRTCAGFVELRARHDDEFAPFRDRLVALLVRDVRRAPVSAGALLVFDAAQRGPRGLPDFLKDLEELIPGLMYNDDVHADCNVGQFQSVLWTSILLATVLLVVLCLLCNMSTAKEPILYTGFDMGSRKLR